MNCFAKNYLWVLDANDCGGVDKVVSIAKATGYGLCAKWHDGDPSDDKWGWRENFAKITARCGDVPVIGWGYCYGDTYGNLAKEADCIAKFLLDHPQAGYVIDAESEWEVPAGRGWAQRLGEPILAQVSDARERLAYAPFWNMEYHPRYPAAELSQFCSAVLPQDYFALGKKDTYAKQRDMVETSLREFAPYGLPVYPIGEFGPRGLGDVAAFLSLIGGRPHSWWLVDGWQDSDEMAYLAQINRAAVNPLAARVAVLEDTLEKVKEAVKAV